MKAGFGTNCGWGWVELELVLKQIVGAGGLNEGCLRDKLWVGVSGIMAGFETNCG